MIAKNVWSVVEESLCPSEEKPESQKSCDEDEGEEGEEGKPEVKMMYTYSGTFF